MTFARSLHPFALAALLLSAHVPLATAAKPEIFPAATIQELRHAIEQAILDGECPGAVIWLERTGAVYTAAFGSRAILPAREAMTTDTIFDLASLSKTIACAPSIMLLVERGKIALDEPVSTSIPEFSGPTRDPISVRQLLTHTSGLRPGLSGSWQAREGALQKACQENPVTRPGTEFKYSDINFILLGEIVRRVSGMPLNEFARRELFIPLNMTNTMFLPSEALGARVAPTEVVASQVFRGIVHDPSARRMGGVAGHAGLFSTGADLARFARMLLNGGELNGVRVFDPESVRLMTTPQGPPGISVKRGLGWDIDSPYSGPRGEFFSSSSYGHTGWTGTSIWIDPTSNTFVILLTNRNHPTERGSVTALRRRVSTLAAQAAGLSPAQSNAPVTASNVHTNHARPPASRPSHAVLNGIDVLVQQNFTPLKDLRLGLITNHTGHDRDRRSTIDLLFHAPGLQLKALFSPEHGLRGALDEPHGDSLDPNTGLPIYSLYGATRKPATNQLAGLDALVFDIQDIGCRFYTYTSTMALCMEAAASAGLKFFVFDRVNPINGTSIEGPVLAEPPTFVGYHAVPLRHGLTIGELATLFRTENLPHLDLTVVRLQNWKRSQYLDETGLAWTHPSPNMRSLEAAILYPGIGLLETALSVGRGTDTPFQVVGAPYINDVELADSLNAACLPGVRFLAVEFTPASSVFAGQQCYGVRVILTDRTQYNSVETGLMIAKNLLRLYPGKFDPSKMANLLMDASTLKALRGDAPLDELRALWKDRAESFFERRESCLLYQ